MIVDFVKHFRVGSAQDPIGKEGLCNLTAAMMAEGGTRRRSYKQILEECFEMATGVEQQVDKELTVFYGSAHPDHEGRFGEIFREALEEPTFSEEDFNRLRDEQLNFLRVGLRGNNDEELAKEILYSRIFAGTPYRHHTVGTVKGLEAITLDDVTTFYERHFKGGFIEPTEIGREPKEGVHATLLDKPEARSVAISFGHWTPVTRRHPDYHALLVAQSWLGQHRNGGRLFDQIREVRGLNYGDYAYLEYFPNGMYQFEPDPCLARSQQIFQVWIRPVVWEKAIFALRLGCYEIEQLRERGISEEDFARTQNFLRKYSKLLVKTGSLRKLYAIDSEFYGHQEYTDFIETGLARLTREHVNEAARAHLETKNLELVAVGPRMAEFARQLESGEPTPISYETEMTPETIAEDEVVSRWPLDVAKLEVLSYLEALES